MVPDPVLEAYDRPSENFRNPYEPIMREQRCAVLIREVLLCSNGELNIDHLENFDDPRESWPMAELTEMVLQILQIRRIPVVITRKNNRKFNVRRRGNGRV